MIAAWVGTPRLKSATAPAIRVGVVFMAGLLSSGYRQRRPLQRCIRHGSTPPTGGRRVHTAVRGPRRKKVPRDFHSLAATPFEGVSRSVNLVRLRLSASEEVHKMSQRMGIPFRCDRAIGFFGYV